MNGLAVAVLVAAAYTVGYFQGTKIETDFDRELDLILGRS